MCSIQLIRMQELSATSTRRRELAALGLKVSGSGTIADATQAATAISGLTTGSPTPDTMDLVFYTTAPACSHSIGYANFYYSLLLH